MSGSVSDFSGMNLGGVHGHVSAVESVQGRVVEHHVSADSVASSSVVESAEMFHLGGPHFSSVHWVNSLNDGKSPTAGSSVSGNVSSAGSGNLRGLENLGRDGAGQKKNSGDLF